jgi:hypothetical protein
MVMTKVEVLVKDMEEVLDLLNKDLAYSQETLGQNLILAEGTQDLSKIWSIIRMRIRQVTSVFETACFYFKYLGGELCRITKKSVPDKLQSFLDPQNKFEFKERIKQSFEILALALNKEFEIDNSSKEWNALCNLIKKRDQITHPKSIRDLDVNEDDLKKVNEALFWFANQMYKAMGEAPLPPFKLPSEEEISLLKENIQKKMTIPLPQK